MTDKAYLCRSDYYEVSDIVFAPNRNKARWDFINRHCEGELCDQSVRRAKYFDQFAEDGRIPAKEAIWDGWWLECWRCGMHMDEDTLTDEGKNVDDVHGFLHQAVYCSSECLHESRTWQARREQIENEIIQGMLWRLEDRFPESKIELVGKYVYVFEKDERIGSAQLDVVIDGYRCKYGSNLFDDNDVSLDEWKKLTHKLIPPYDRAVEFLTKYGFEIPENYSLT